MAKNDNDNTQAFDAQNTEVVDDAVEEVVDDVMGVDNGDGDVESVPAVKTKKELKQERKQLKKHKKEVKKEAKRHSATTTKAERFWIVVLRIFVIVMMVICVVLLVETYQNINELASSDTSDTSASSSTGSTSSSSANSSGGTSSSSSSSSSADDTDSSASDTASADSADTDAASSDDSSASSDGSSATTSLSTKEEIVEYYKTAHAKVLSSASSVTKYYDNTLNYNDYLNINGNSTLEGIAQTLMSSFMTEDTTEYTYTGSDIAANFPPSNSTVDGLTADIVSEATCVEDGDNYIITITIDSTEDNYDTGEKTGNLLNIVSEEAVTNAAGSLVTLSGLENRYIGGNVTATIEKSTGNMIALETDLPSYMCFDEAKVLIISVQDVGIGLEYLQKWTIAY